MLEPPPFTGPFRKEELLWVAADQLEREVDFRGCASKAMGLVPGKLTLLTGSVSSRVRSRFALSMVLQSCAPSPYRSGVRIWWFNRYWLSCFAIKALLRIQMNRVETEGLMGNVELGDQAIRQSENYGFEFRNDVRSVDAICRSVVSEHGECPGRMVLVDRLEDFPEESPGVGDELLLRQLEQLNALAEETGLPVLVTGDSATGYEAVSQQLEAKVNIISLSNSHPA